MVRFKENLDVRIHEIRNGDSHYEKLTISLQSLAAPYGMPTIEIAVVEMWEFRPNQLLLFCASDKNQKGKVNKKGVVNNTFIWDHENNIIRESKFFHTPDFQDLQVDMFGTPVLSMFPTFMMADRQRK
jgi:hypothetical protein